MTEQGEITVNQQSYRVIKHGMMSGHWTMENGSRAVFSAQKSNGFTREFQLWIPGSPEKYTLSAESALGRTMQLTGPKNRFTCRPDHAFTRRASISGSWTSFELPAFAFWLVALMWKRTQQSSSSSGAVGAG